MKVGTWLRRLLPILAIVGLVAGPFTAPVDGAAMAAATSMSMPEMAADMLCCPDDGPPAFPDCQTTCPLMAMCAGKSLPGTPMTASEAFLVQSDVIRPRSDRMGEPLTNEPPSRPPRS